MFHLFVFSNNITNKWNKRAISGFGVLMGLAGLLGWTMHPDGLVKLLS
jgi:hypothetical protein